MAGICLCSSRFLLKNLKSNKVSHLTRISSKSKSQWTYLCASGFRSAIRNSHVSKKAHNASLPYLSKILQGTCYLHTSSCLGNEMREIKVPPFAESISEGTLKWDKDVGDAVKEDEEICQIETDKTSVAVLSPAAGVIEEKLVEDDAVVTPGEVICKIKVGAEAASKPSSEKAESSKEPSSSQSEASPSEVSSSPPSTPPPVPPKPSAPMSSKPVSSIKIPVTPMPLSPKEAEKSITGSRTETRVKMSKMRQRIAQRLKESQNTYASLATFNEIDMSNIIDLRNKYKDDFLKKYNIKLGFMSAFVKAATYALQDQPVINGVIDGDDHIIYRDYIDISVAVATPKGLVVPVLRNLGNMNYADIEKGIHALGEKARTGALAIEDMDGGTFTISNGGVFGSLLGTPIINPPQSAVLGMYNVVRRPVAVNNQVEIRPMMYIALSYDHRLIDGREAANFLKKVKAAVEDPRIMFLGL